MLLNIRDALPVDRVCSQDGRESCLLPALLNKRQFTPNGKCGVGVVTGPSHVDQTEPVGFIFVGSGIRQQSAHPLRQLCRRRLAIGGLLLERRRRPEGHVEH